MLRPKTFEDYIGQDIIKPLLMGIIANCNATHKPLSHTLCFGPPGTGKTTLAGIVANALDDYHLVSLTASKDWTPDTLRRILLDLPIHGYSKITNDGEWIPGAPKYLVFIDEVAEIRNELWTSVMLNAMEDGELHIGATTSWLPEITFFGCTTDPYKIPAAALSRLSLQLHLTPYSVEDLEQIIGRSYPDLSANLRTEVATRSRGIARLALNFAEGVSAHGLSWFSALKIDAEGLNELDRKYLAALDANKGAPMALGTIANVVGENPRTLQAFVEPEMQRLGKIIISAHGRSLVSAGRGAKLRSN